MVRTHEIELFNLLRKQKPNVLVICETKADTRKTFSSILSGDKMEQIITITKCNSPFREGKTVVMNPGGKKTLQKITCMLSENRNDQVKQIEVRMDQNTSVAGIYTGPQSSG